MSETNPHETLQEYEGYTVWEFAHLWDRVFALLLKRELTEGSTIPYAAEVAAKTADEVIEICRKHRPPKEPPHTTYSVAEQ